MPKTPAEKIAALEAKKSAIEARLKKEKARESQAARKADTRRKIIVGAGALAHAQLDPVFALALGEALNKAVTREQDIEVISDLLDLATKPAAKPATATPKAEPPKPAASQIATAKPEAARTVTPPPAQPKPPGGFQPPKGEPPKTGGALNFFKKP